MCVCVCENRMSLCKTSGGDFYIHIYIYRCLPKIRIIAACLRKKKTLLCTKIRGIEDFYRCSINRFPLRTRLFLLIGVLSPIVIKRWRHIREGSCCRRRRRRRGLSAQSPPLCRARCLPTPFRDAYLYLCI